MYWNIEITDYNTKTARLTLTWDVLKWNGVVASFVDEIWLTLTWDVLK